MDVIARSSAQAQVRLHTTHLLSHVCGEKVATQANCSRATSNTSRPASADEHLSLCSITGIISLVCRACAGPSQACRSCRGRARRCTWQQSAQWQTGRCTLVYESSSARPDTFQPRIPSCVSRGPFCCWLALQRGAKTVPPHDSPVSRHATDSCPCGTPAMQMRGSHCSRQHLIPDSSQLAGLCADGGRCSMGGCTSEGCTAKAHVGARCLWLEHYRGEVINS